MGRPVALVTGARRGIGKAIAVELARAGFDIAVNDFQTSAELDDVVMMLQDLGAQAIPSIADLSDIGSHEQWLATVEKQLGPLDCLVNNAGVSVMSRGDLLDVTPQSYDRCLHINTRGTFFLMQAFAKAALKRDADVNAHPRSIITITSSNAVAASPARSEYCVSKAGLSMATTLFSLRLAEEGISVYEVQPGFIETEMTAPSKSRYDALMAAGLTAIQRWGRPEDVAVAVRSLATGSLPYSVGQAIRVDGGLLVNKY